MRSYRFGEWGFVGVREVDVWGGVDVRGGCCVGAEGWRG
jgi:hypothetical protein